MTGSTLGVEEEFLLVDAEGIPTPQSPALLGKLPSNFKPELRASQIEAVTPPRKTLAELRQDLVESREHLAVTAHEMGVRVLPVGSPIRADEPASDFTTTDARHRGIHDLYAGSLRDYNVCACQIHVCVEDDDLAIAILNQVREWLPILLSLGVNSPFANSVDTGFSSWRVIQQSRFPCSGLPPYSTSADQYEDRMSVLTSVGALFDDRTSFWLARRSPRYPTIEFRVADSAATVDDAILQAALCRALVNTAIADLERGLEPRNFDEQCGSAAVWTAARYGLTGPSIDPVTGESFSATSRAAELFDYVAEALADTGDYDLTAQLLDDIERHGTGAARQRKLAQGGLDALIDGIALTTGSGSMSRQTGENSV
ncbi:YbdK family carboxylate-amine ligase [Smaragdicoccus niigatensis]|uniref:carboxylate-amine ligase n=1 Tax=Smaragdicoccus niigatensis TaxID=359359 RepID=UPI00036F68CD|nr:YbdK family carboxylate-amine ligase [Smaragdicoccus niigatensis]